MADLQASFAAQRIDICICAFRRPRIVDTLASVAALERMSHWSLRVIVADNDDTAAAESMIRAAFARLKIEGVYVHAPARNISTARNAALDAATAPFVAFIDDDEIVSPNWLIALMSTMEKTAADIVVGPVRAVYPPDVAAWMKTGDFHSLKPVLIEDRLIAGGCGNVVLRVDAPALKGRRFRLDLGKTGGEDTVFFAGARKRGAVIAYAADAVVSETVTARRATLRWLLSRRFRYGQTYARLLVDSGRASVATRTRAVLIAGLKVLVCFVMAALTSLFPARRYFWILRGTLHYGAVCRLLGFDNTQPYSRSEEASA